MTNQMQRIGEGLLLKGLDGSNPLAFLAALGTLRTLSLVWPEKKVKMSWVQYAGTWRPILDVQEILHFDEDTCLDALDSAFSIQRQNHPILKILDNSSPRSVSDLPETYWYSALTSDIQPEEKSLLQTVRRDYFRGNVQSILKLTNRDHLLRTLFHSWDYADKLDNQSLHLDPTEDRRYAYQWHQPSGDPERKKSGGMLGANRLAIEALPLFQSFARDGSKRLATCGFTSNPSEDIRFTWPIWNGWLACPVIVSLLALQELQEPIPNKTALAARGLVSAYRCRRILVEKTNNLTPSTAVFCSMPEKKT